MVGIDRRKRTSTESKSGNGENNLFHKFSLLSLKAVMSF
ncbi:Uncharacterised protein [Vibrio cholerae]|nr:Uncharacterised protein [Vibrio cholerae]